ncbi:HNH endonuclease signature motif containing protein [Ornithinimicrobium flavum]|uniref:HNH endonuclease signature motif containing protein n=1 Tax=Ornithinimicrobium flavum TaxID=1288636 RepID=UPI00106F6550|nr:HNH endonuclease signature motif containing protein [Ornithinimicrobium flavum]
MGSIDRDDEGARQLRLVRGEGPRPAWEGGTARSSGGPDPSAVALQEALRASGMPEALASTCAVVLPAITRLVVQGADVFLQPSEAISVAEEAAAMTSLLEGCRMLAARDLAVEAGSVILAERGTESADSMARTVRERWEATCRALSAEELAAATGQGRWHTRETAAIGLAPPPLMEHVLTGLRTGVARWSLVTAFWRRCWSNPRIPREVAIEIAGALFGDDLSRVVVERITADGELSRAPWGDKQFHQALEREATRREAQDPAATAADRAEQHRRRNAFGFVDDDGSGQVVISGDTASVSACVDRLHVLARRARAAGDERTEPQLRSDIARSLLLHGVLPLPDLGDEIGVITPDDIESLVQILSGTPSYELQVVVPWDSLGAHALVPLDGATGFVNVPHEVGAAEGDPEDGAAAAPGSHPAASDGVGRVLGRFPRFLTKAEVLAIAGGHGVTLSRLLIDPADGRCLERTVAAYRPDATMRAQIRAADVFSRFPGSTIPVRDGDLDHVVPYLLGGPTTELNLQGLHRTGHVLKTSEHWKAQMDATRNVTWTSFFGRLYTTRTHDYRQYLSSVSALPGPLTGRAPDLMGSTSARAGDAPRDHAQERRDHAHEHRDPAQDRRDERHLASFLTYAALCARRAGAPLEKPGDDPTSDEWLASDSYRAIWVRHTRPDGRKVPGPRPGTPSPEQLITVDPRSILEADQWTEAVRADGPARPGSATKGEGDPRGEGDAGGEGDVRGEGDARGHSGGRPGGDDPVPF